MARAVFAIVVTVAIPCPVMAGAFSGSHGLFPVCLMPRAAADQAPAQRGVFRHRGGQEARARAK